MDVSIITNWLKQAPSVAWSLVVLIGLMLWGPDWFRSGLGLEAFITEYRNYLGVFFPAVIGWWASTNMARRRQGSLRYPIGAFWQETAERPYAG